MERLASYLSEWLERQITGSGGRGAIFGLSGGIDSTVVAALCRRALPHHTLGLVLPCGSDPRDADDARLAASHFAVASCTVDLTPTFGTFSRELAR